MLVVAPHADDEMLGMGGTLARAIDAGIKAGVALLTTRTDGFRRCSSIVGFEPIHLRRPYAEGKLSQNRRALAEQLVTIFRVYRPDAVFAPCRCEPHDDHQTAAWATRYAAWRAMRIQPNGGKPHRVNWLLFYEILGPYGDAAFLVDTSGRFFEIKTRALLEAYRREIDRSPDYFIYSEQRARLRGLQFDTPSDIKKQLSRRYFTTRTASMQRTAEAFYLE